MRNAQSERHSFLFINIHYLCITIGSFFSVGTPYFHPFHGNFYGTCPFQPLRCIPLIKKHPGMGAPLHPYSSVPEGSASIIIVRVTATINVFFNRFINVSLIYRIVMLISNHSPININHFRWMNMLHDTPICSRIHHGPCRICNHFFPLFTTSSTITTHKNTTFFYFFVAYDIRWKLVLSNNTIF